MRSTRVRSNLVSPGNRCRDPLDDVLGLRAQRAEQARAELEKIRRKWELEQQRSASMARVMSKWRDPYDCR